MRVFALVAAIMALVSSAVAVDRQMSVIISYASNTPDSVVTRAKQAVREAGGVITHEYQLIKGFACLAPEKILDTVRAWGSEYRALVEEDQMVKISA